MKGWFVRGYTDYMSPEGRSRAPGALINDIAFPWLEEKKKDDFFLFLHFWDPHIPYVPPSPFKERYTASSATWTDPLMAPRLRSRPTYPLFKRNHYDHLDSKPNLDYVADLYDGEVAYLDFEINRLFEHLGALGILDETLVVLFGDHGENMTEHDAWFDHAGLYDSVVHVPLIMWCPGLVPRTRVDSMVQLVDIMPTVLDIVGLPQVDGIDGQSLLPVMTQEVATHREVVYLSECTWQAKRGIRTGDWKFIHCTDPGVFPRSENELYDLRNDPDEQKNVALEYPDIASELNGKLNTWLADQLVGRPDPMLRVVSDGLPAVVRLDGVIDEAEREAHQVRDKQTAETPAIAAAEAHAELVTATSTLPAAPIMAPGGPVTPAGGSALAPAGAAPPEKRKRTRRRVIFVAVTSILAVLALYFVVMYIFPDNIEVPGVLQPKETVDLNFADSGPVDSISVAMGESVHHGEVLATQETSTLASQLQADEAKLAAADTMLAAGPTPAQTPQQLQSQVAQAQVALTTAQAKGWSQATLDSLTVTNANSQVSSDQSTLTNDQQATGPACSAAPQGSTSACSAAEHQDVTDQAALTAAQGAYQQALQTRSADASNGQNVIAEAKAALAAAQANAAAGTQPQTETQVNSERASVEAAQAEVSTDMKALSAAKLVAPFAGMVAEVNGNVGDLAGPNGVQQQAPQGGVSTPSSGITLFPSPPVTPNTRTPQQESLITLQSRQMNVVAQVGESEVAHVHIGQRAKVTFPADRGVVYDAEVVTIDPTAVDQSGSAYFLVYVQLVTEKGRPIPGPRLKGLAGLSADVTFD
jgi:multidrug efflux pump subunit AcrA (membrane-fusion protein)